MPINTKFSASTFQQNDGTNFSTAGLDFSKKFGSATLSSYAGVGTAFTDGSTGLVADVKGSVPYGKTPFSGGFRVRNNINDNSQTVQFRVQPLSFNTPISKKTSIYATPYVATKLNYQTSKATTNFGGFAGVSTKIGKASVFLEGQLYDFSKINNSTTSINAGV